MPIADIGAKINPKIAIAAYRAMPALVTTRLSVIRYLPSDLSHGLSAKQAGPNKPAELFHRFRGVLGFLGG